ncbi:MAG: chitobiase/beta-hexosaminidase C-terminal domain-containing protein [Parcubacteria group bacterium]
MDQGDHTFDVRAKDLAGNIDPSPASRSWTADTVAPAEPTAMLKAGGIDVLTNGYTNSQTFTFNLSSSSATRYQLKYWNDISGSHYKETTPWNPTTLSAVYPDNFTQGEGMHYFAFSACDAANNCSDYADPFVVTYDKTAPVLSSQTIFSGWHNTIPQTSMFNYTDANMADDYSAPTCNITAEGAGQTCSIMPNVCDKAGNCNTFTAVSNGADIDTIAPTTSDNADSDWHNADVTVTLTCGDGTGSGCDKTYYTTDGSDPTTSSATGNSVVLDSDGEFTVKYFSVDNAGNVEDVKTASNTVKIDKTAPTATVSYDTTDWTNGSVIATLNPSESVDVTNNSGNTTYSFSGNGTFTFEFVDVAGNTGSALATVGNIDKTAPTTTVSGIDSDWHSASVTVNFSCDDASGSGCDKIYYTTDGSDPTTSSATGNSVEISDEGQTVVKYFSADKVGNDESVKTSDAVKIDKTKPESTINGGVNNEIVYSNSWDGNISGTAVDSPSGVAGIKLSIQNGVGKYWNGSVWQDGEILVDATGDISWNYTLTSLNEGSYTIKSHAVDNAGNMENTYTLTIIFDRTIPEVNLSIEPSNPDGDNDWYVSYPTISLSASDKNLDRIEYQIDSDSGAWNAYSSPVKIEDGTHAFYYRSIDKAGNVSNIGVKNAKVDTRDPDNVKNLDAEYDEEENAVKLTWNADDSDIDEVLIYQGKSRDFRVNSGSRIAKNDDSDDGYTDDNVSRGEKYYYKFVTRDEAGNASNVKIISASIPEEGGQAIITDEGTEALPQGTVAGEESGEEQGQGNQNSGTEEEVNTDEGGQVAGAEEAKEDSSGAANWNWSYGIAGIIIVLIAGIWLWQTKRNNKTSE